MQTTKPATRKHIGMTVLSIVLVLLFAVVCWRMWGASGQDSVSAVSGDTTTQPLESIAGVESPQEQ